MIGETKIVINWLSSEDKLNQYRLRIYWLTKVKSIVVVSNITDFPGRKIADITPRIIYFVNNNFALASDKIMLVEHYPINSLHEDLYFHVLYVNNEAIRYEINKDKLTRLIGKPI